MSLLAPSQPHYGDVVETLGGFGEYGTEAEPDGRRDPTFGGRLFISVEFRLTASY